MPAALIRGNTVTFLESTSKTLTKILISRTKGSTNDQTKALIRKTKVPLKLYIGISLDHRKDTKKRTRNKYNKNKRVKCIRHHIQK